MQRTLCFLDNTPASSSSAPGNVFHIPIFVMLKFKEFYPVPQNSARFSPTLVPDRAQLKTKKVNIFSFFGQLKPFLSRTFATTYETSQAKESRPVGLMCLAMVTRMLSEENKEKNEKDKL